MHIVRALGALSGFILAGIIFVILGPYAGPQVEARFFPILKPLHIANSVTREGNSLCWSTHMTKLHVGSPAYFEYRILHGPDIIATAPYRIDESGQRRYLSKRGFVETHPPGAEWDTRYCFDIPSGIVDAGESFGVEGDGQYDVPHGLWRVPQPLPSFEVPGG